VRLGIVPGAAESRIGHEMTVVESNVVLISFVVLDTDVGVSAYLECLYRCALFFQV